MKKKKLLITLLFATIGLYALGQSVTTSSINGRVIDDKGEPVPFAIVMALHEPSGSSYGTSTRDDGGFNVPNIRTGGPYTITTSFLGYKTVTLSDVYLSLGEDRNFTFTLYDEGIELEEVMIVYTVNKTFNSDRTGAVTNLNTQNIQEMPTISRTIEDYTRLSPLSNGSSFAGRDNRFNNYTIDGNIYNNNFGLGSGQFAASNPISMEVIEEIQINIAPFDVRQGGFTGANVNAITKSGTNQFRGSLYAYYRNQQMLGLKIGEEKLSVDDAFTNIRGVSVGGPIIKDRLFFFASFEQEAASNPGDNRRASRPGLAPDGQTVSRVPAEHMDFVREQMKAIYGYETGPYENYPFGNEALRMNFRLDLNINPKHRASLRYNHYQAFRDITINGNSVRNVTRYGNTNRYGIEALTFRNANYSNDYKVNSLVAEVNSIISNRFANNLNIGYTYVQDPKRGIPGDQTFPFIEVLEWVGGDIPGGDINNQGTPLYYFSLGNELYSVGNLLANNIFNVTNNFSMFIGKHTLTAGVNFEYMTFDNAFNPNAHTFYRFNSYQNFLDVVVDRLPGAVPDGFAMSYSYAGPNDLPMDETAFGQFGVYLQDKFKINNNLVVTGGLRIDVPFFPIDLPRNDRLEEIAPEFTDPLDPNKIIIPDVSQLPPLRLLLSPRLSFNYDVFGDNSLQLRGGTGFFSGRIPFVWISNQVSANGVTRGMTGWDRYTRRTDDEGNPYWQENLWGQGGRPEWDGFKENPAFYKPSGDDLEAQVSRDINITDPDFKFPQVWRTNLAADYRLPFDIIATLEGIYSKDFNSPLAQNINLAEPAGTFSGIDQRPYYSSYTANSDFNEVMMLTNTNKGYYWSITAQLQKDFENGIVTSIAYTRGVSRDYGLIGGSQAGSLWPNVVQENRNDPEIGYSRFDQPNRIVGYVSLNTKVFNPINTTTISLYYIGGEGGRYSYVYSGNFGDRASRLMYIPKEQSDITFLPLNVGGQEISPAEQWNILDEYIKQDNYLSKHRGEIAERNGALLPWLHRFDLRVAQDIVFTNSPDRNKIQITFDILNVGNLINSEWGVSENVWQSAPINYVGRNSDTNLPEYRLNTISGTTGLPTETYRTVINIDQTWKAQVGVRYVF
jgi:hypothetical protein